MFKQIMLNISTNEIYFKGSTTTENICYSVLNYCDSDEEDITEMSVIFISTYVDTPCNGNRNAISWTLSYSI